MDDPRQCSTLRRIVSRWFSALKRGKATKRSEKRDKEIARETEGSGRMELILQNAKEELCSNNALLNNSGSQFSLQSVAVGDECVTGMDQLETELEAELERLQLHLDSESNSSIAIASKSPQQQRIKGIGDIGSSNGSSASTDYSDECPPGALELLRFNLRENCIKCWKRRQQERIKELEDALECAENKLHDKENRGFVVETHCNTYIRP